MTQVSQLDRQASGSADLETIKIQHLPSEGFEPCAWGCEAVAYYTHAFEGKPGNYQQPLQALLILLLIFRLVLCHHVQNKTHKKYNVKTRNLKTHTLETKTLSTQNV